jgi:predicted alpha/beta superfamily hydrolase
MRTTGLLLALFSILFSFLGAAEAQPDDSIVIGKRTGFHSAVLDEWRTLEVYLPKSYESSERSYPALIVLDGGWMFQYCVSLIHMMSPNHFPEMIVIGLPNTDRRRDMNPVTAPGTGPEKGTENFLHFLGKELLPHLGREYRTLPYRILTGHSLAGFATIHTLVREPELFNAYIATSPSLQNPDRMKIVRDNFSSEPSERYAGKYVYFSAGGEEGEEIRAAVGDFSNFLKRLKAPGFEIASETFEKEGHVPVKGFYQGLRKLFPNWIMSRELLGHGDVVDIRAHYSALSRKYGFEVAPPPDILTTIGRRRLREDEVHKAIEVFKDYVSHYPKSSEAYLLLGEAYQEANQFELAEQNVRKALELDPENEDAKTLLEELSKT